MPAEPSSGPPRLLIVATVYNMIRDFLLPFADHYRELGWRVDALGQRDYTYRECAPAFDRAYAIDWSRHPRRIGNVPRQLRTVRTLVERERYDLVHVHTPVAGLLTRAALHGSRARGAPRVIYTAHGFHFHRAGSPLLNALYIAAEKLAGRWTDYLVVINQADEVAARRFRLVPAGRLLRMPGIGIDLDRYGADGVSAAEVACIRCELGLEPTDGLLLMVAEFTVNKRHRDAVLAFARLGRPDAHLAIAGREGPTLAATRRLVGELGVEGQVHLLGYRNDIPALIRASVATVLVSAREGLPRSVMESLCLGTPVIGTRIRGVGELLNGGSGRLVPVGDVEALHRAMEWTLDHRDAARVAAERGRRRMRLYDVHRVIELHDELYARALHGAPAPRPVPFG